MSRITSRTKSAGFACNALKRKIERLEQSLHQVDDFLAENHIVAIDGDYKTALRQSTTLDIQIATDPCVNGGSVLLNIEECGILNKLLAGYHVGPTARAVLDKIKPIPAPDFSIY